MKNLETDYDSVYEVQVFLNALHHSSGGELPLVHPDGIYGSETTAAVLAFQAREGLAESGEVDFVTYTALRDAYYLAVREPMPLYVFPSADYRARSGEQSELIELTQLLLHGLSDHYDGLSGSAPSGVLDESTEADLREFQRIHALEQHGELDLATWDALALAYDRRVRRVR